MVSEWLYACVRQMRKPSKHGESKLASNSYVWMLLNSSFAVYLFKYYENNILKEFNIYFFFFERGFLTLFWGRTEGDVWLEALSIMFQINVKMLPIKIRFWLISSWLTRKETRKSQMLLGCIQCKSWEESVTKTKPSVSPRTLIILLQDILQQPVQIGLNELTQKPAVIYK